MKRAKKQVRIIKKIRESSGVWRFVSLQKIGNRYVWDERHGYYFLDWREGKARKREFAGETPAEATESHRRKRNELIGEMVTNGRQIPADQNESFTLISKCKEMFIDHVKAHSPDKPETIRRYTSFVIPTRPDCSKAGATLSLFSI
jgi:hypothetical protein